MFLMRITKVKHWSKLVQSESVDHVRISYVSGDSEITVHEFGENSEGAPEFYQAFDNLSVYVCRMCSLDESLKDGIQVKDVTITKSEDKEGNDTTEYKLNCTLKAGHANAVLNISIQHKFVPEGFEDAIKILKKEAEAYVKGKREQVDLFDSENQVTDTGTDDDGPEEEDIESEEEDEDVEVS